MQCRSLVQLSGLLGMLLFTWQHIIIDPTCAQACALCLQLPKQLPVVTCSKCKAVGCNIKGMLWTQLQACNASFTLVPWRPQNSCVGVDVSHHMLILAEAYAGRAVTLMAGCMSPAHRISQSHP